ncbi:MAG: hypothetical protein AB4352_13180 [Hormoscilla sp.]
MLKASDIMTEDVVTISAGNIQICWNDSKIRRKYNFWIDNGI